MTMCLLIVGVFILLDIITGLIESIRLGEFTSKKMRQGLLAKFQELLIVVLVYAIQYGFPMLGVAINIPIVQPICLYIVVMEVGSILENVSKTNEKISQFTKKYLKQIKEMAGDSDEE